MEVTKKRRERNGIRKFRFVSIYVPLIKQSRRHGCKLYFILLMFTITVTLNSIAQYFIFVLVFNDTMTALFAHT